MGSPEGSEQAVRKYFHEELDELEEDILRMGELVIAAVKKSVKAISEVDASAADEVINGDDAIDSINLRTEEMCMHMLARQQPVAIDLRTIYSMLVIANHLERCGDLAVNIAKIAMRKRAPSILRVAEEKSLQLLGEMGDRSCDIVSESIKAFAGRDLGLAERLNKQDDPIDKLYKQFLKELRNCHEEEEDLIDSVISLILASRYLERIADHAVDIGERVTYMVTGQYRH